MSFSGTIALVGRPNVGKSTLMNQLLGERLSIVSAKAQTTRHRIRGVLTQDDYQFIFVDTPGQAKGEGKAMNRLLDKTAMGAMQDVDIVLWLVEAGRFNKADEAVLARLQRDRPKRLGLLANKVDLFKKKEELLPFLGQMAQRIQADFYVPVSAEKGQNVDALMDELRKYLPEGPFFYEEDTLTPHSGEFLVSERIREQIFHRLHEELPYAMTVSVDRMEDSGEQLQIHATIWVNRNSHKGMVIGKQGQTLKAIGQSARLSLGELFECPVELNLWVKVREGWADNEDSVRAFGYGATD